MLMVNKNGDKKWGTGVIVKIFFEQIGKKLWKNSEKSVEKLLQKLVEKLVKQIDEN